MAFDRRDWYPTSHTRPTSDAGVVEIVIDNRTMLLALDWMYRETMKCFETKELLLCAQEVCARLGIGPSNCPVEGYYTESAELRRYFLLMRSLQNVQADHRGKVQDMETFRLLEKVTTSSIFGSKRDEGYLFPRSRTCLTDALEQFQGTWNVEKLVKHAQQLARASDEYSLTGLAARTGDAVVLAALRESVCLFEMVGTGYRKPITYHYIWEVDDDLCRLANCFVQAFNGLVGDRYGRLPKVTSDEAQNFSLCSRLNEIVGRCICIGKNFRGDHYHWAVCMRREDEEDPGSLYVDEFWSAELWTTERYRKLQGNKMQMRPFAELEGHPGG